MIEKMARFNMQHDDIRDMFRENIVKRSIQILRKHGKSDEAIKAMMLKDFLISEKALDELIKTDGI